MQLTDTAVRKAKLLAKPYKMTDGGGMYLFVHSNGGKYWRMDYRFAGKQKTLALGVYPDVSLADARDRKDEARAMLRRNSDPAIAKREAKIEAAQQKEVEKLAVTQPCFRLSISGGALTIQTKNNRMTLSPEQTDAVQAFLIATPDEANHEQTD